jgi:vacuolar-type H+-ATPase subunit D/Vma8
LQRRRQLLHLLLHQRSQVKLLQQLHKLLRQKLRLLHLQLRSHHVWVHLVVRFRLRQAVVVQFRHLLVAQVERRVLVVRQWVAVLRALVLVLALVEFLQVLLVADQ